MNTNEFKAWFEGFTDCMDSTPSKKQWDKIKQRISEITPEPTTVRYFYDHYYRPLWGMPYSYGNGQTTYSGLTQNNADYLTNGTFSDEQLGTITRSCNSGVGLPENLSTQAVSLDSFNALGRVDATSLSQG